MAETKIQNIFTRLQKLQEAEDQAAAPGAKAEHGAIKNLGGNLNIQKLNVAGGDDTNLEVGDSAFTSDLNDLDASVSASNPTPDKAKPLNMNTGTELLEDEGSPESDSEEEEPDYSGDEADLDSELGNPFGDEEEGEGETPEGEAGEHEETLDSVEKLLRAAFDNPELSVSIGVNLPKGGEESPAEEEAAEELPPEEPTEEMPSEGEELHPAEDYGEDQATMESFLKDIDNPDQKKNSEDSEDDGDDEKDDSDCGSSSPMGY